MLNPDTFDQLVSNGILPAGARESRHTPGEWYASDLAFPVFQTLPHRTGSPDFYLRQVGDQVQVICALRWGRSKCRIQLESAPQPDYLQALSQVCQQAALIPRTEAHWTAHFAHRRPDLPKGTVSLSNHMPVGMPRFAFTYNGMNGGCSTLPQASLRQAFEDLVALADYTPPAPAALANGKTPAPDLERLAKRLQDWTFAPVELLTQTQKLPDGSKGFGLHARWQDLDGSRRKVLTTFDHVDWDAAARELEAMMLDALAEGPRQPTAAIRHALKGLTIASDDIAISYRGSQRPICHIRIRQLGEVESNAAPHRTAALRGALELLVKLAAKPPQLRDALRRPQVDLIAAWLAFAKRRWQEERDFLMAQHNLSEVDRQRLQQLSRFFAALEPLRKYELDRAQRDHAAGEMVNEIKQTLLQNQPAYLEANQAAYLRLLCQSHYADPGHPVQLDSRCMRQLFSQSQSPSTVLQQLLTEHLLRREGADYALSAIGANRMETALRNGFGRHSLSARLPPDTVQALVIPQSQLQASST